MSGRNIIAPVGIMPIGATVAINGQEFTAAGAEPYTRNDGQQSTIAVWTTLCAECDQPLTVKAPLGRWPETRRCELHRRPGKKVAHA